MNDKLRILAYGAATVVVVAIAFFAIRAAGNVGNLDQGQVKYTPGVPPWMDKKATAVTPGSPSGGAPAISNSGK